MTKQGMLDYTHLLQIGNCIEGRLLVRNRPRDVMNTVSKTEADIH